MDLFCIMNICLQDVSYAFQEPLSEFFVWELHVGGLAGHFGNEKTIEDVEYRFYWPSLKYDVAKHVGRCHICQLAKQ